MSTRYTLATGAALLGRTAHTDAWSATRPQILEVDESNVAYPPYVDRAKGAYLWDVDGNKYLDVIMGYGPVVLGHAHERVNEAVIDQLGRGACMSPMWSPRQVELTELLIEVIPGAELAYLLRTGSDATSAAVRLARIFTGRNKIVKWGYNGWHDWTAPRPEGVPAATREHTLTFDYGDIASVQRVFSEHPNDIACVIMMPYEAQTASPEFLAEVKAIAHRNGALFILDEMRSGFRMALGGAQEYLGIEADLSTFSKAMANGYAISAVVGKREVMTCLGRTHMSSTFYGNAPEMAAAIATITELRDTDTIRNLWELGTQFHRGLSDIVSSKGLPAQVVGYPISPFLDFSTTSGSIEAAVRTKFFSGTLAHGVLLHPNHQWFLSGSHTRQDIEFLLEVCEKSAQEALY
ncbi:MAG: aspartate aminotransferase family protein [Angustibacter sp.]